MPARKEPSVKKPGKRSLFDFPYKKRTRRNELSVPTIKGGRSKTHTIGIIVHELQSDFIKAALKGIESIATLQGYEIVITHSQESMQKEVANAQMLFDQRVDGVIASLSFGTTNLDHFKTFIHREVPVVFFDRVEKASGNGMVVIDNEGTGYAATKHLIQQGCKRIAIVTSTMERNVYADRFKGFLHALQDHQLPFSNNLLIVNDISEEAGEEAAMELIRMKERPDGLFITNDLVAAVCMRTLMSHGISVPDDMAIVGFNNDSICKLTMPTITTINYPGFEMGRLAAMQVLAAIEGKCPHHPVATAVVPAELIVRHSSLKNAHASR
jgi:LacI family transcriptional regulator